MAVVAIDQLGRRRPALKTLGCRWTDRRRRVALGLSNFQGDELTRSVGNDFDSRNLDEAANVSASTRLRAPDAECPSP